MAGEILQCRETAMVEYEGVPTLLTKNQTRVEAGHELAERYPELFEPLTVDYTVAENTSARTRDTGRTETAKKATASPAAKRAAKKAAAKQVKEQSPSTVPISKSQVPASQVPTPPAGHVDNQGLSAGHVKDGPTKGSTEPALSDDPDQV